MAATVAVPSNFTHPDLHANAQHRPFLVIYRQKGFFFFVLSTKELHSSDLLLSSKGKYTSYLGILYPTTLAGRTAGAQAAVYT